MVAMISRRLFLRPDIDEPCPDWARPLLPLSSEPDTRGLGVANARVPQETAVALHDLFPAPQAPKRERKREVSERRNKAYIKTWAAAVYFALLPYALAKQVSLFSGSGGETTADVAVLCVRQLSDLASKLGISYDRLQKWMTILLIIGLVRRFRDGRQVLYVLPLTAYVPSPSPEAVLKKLDELIKSQYVEETLPDGRVVWLDRCPKWTTQLLEIRSRFVLRYQPTVSAEELLSPHVSAEKLLPPPSSAEVWSSDQAFQAMLHKVSEAIPEASRSEAMRRLLPILARSYAEIIESTSGRKPLTRPQERAVAHSGEAPRASSFSSHLDIATAQRGETGSSGTTESRFGTPNLDLTGAAANGQSRFDAAHSDQEIGLNSPQSGTGAPAPKLANLDPMVGESLTLRCNTRNNISFEENKNVNVRDAESRLRTENRKKAEQLADLLRVPGNINFYTRLFNQVSRGELGEDLIKAVFIYTLHQERAGDITDQKSDALGKYFYGVFRRWSPQRTYGAACRAYNNKKWHGKTPPGIRPRDKEVIDAFMPYDFNQIADMIRCGVQAIEQSWLPLDPAIEVPVQPMDEQEAEALAQAMREQASWYLWAPTSGPVSSGETVFFVVNAWQDGGKQDGQRWMFTSWGQWLDYHERMLTPPLYLESALRRGRGLTQDTGENQETDDQGTRVIACARAACALFAYLNERSAGHMGDLDWVSLVLSLPFEGLAVLGEPIRFPHERGQAEEPYRGPVAGEGLNVELEEGVVLTYEQFQALLASGAYHGECVELERDGFIPRVRYEELLASGAYVELDDGTPVRAGDYEVLRERVRVELEREEAANRRAETPPVKQREQRGPDRVEASLLPAQTEPQVQSLLPCWWEELIWNMDESNGVPMDSGEALQCWLQMRRALAQQLYRLLVRPLWIGGTLCYAIELSSLCLGWTLKLEKAGQVEMLLGFLEVQGNTEEGDQTYASTLS